MFDLTYGTIDFDLLLRISFIVVLLPIQLLLCFKVKSRLVRLLPILLLGSLGIVFLCLASTSSGWDTLGYLIFIIYVLYAIFICGIGWCIWWIIQRKKRVSNYAKD